VSLGSIELTAEVRRRLLRDATDVALPGDLLFFYHRTSWRSRWIRRVTACEMPHVCVYLGKGRIVGMLRGRVRRHLLRRFFRDEYDVRFVRGSARVLDEAMRFIGRREVLIDLIVLGFLVLFERALGPRLGRRLFPYRMRGVTCSGIASSAWHAAHGIESWCSPMKHTPLDLEMTVGKDAFFEASLVPASDATPLTRETTPARGGVGS
jgi:hypothetical protein